LAQSGSVLGDRLGRGNGDLGASVSDVLVAENLITEDHITVHLVTVDVLVPSDQAAVGSHATVGSYVAVSIRFLALPAIPFFVHYST
jgi:hypothetical protein